MLKRIAYPMLQKVPQEDPNYFMAIRLIKTLNYFRTAPDEVLSEIPPLSILREFIGGNTFYA